MPKRVNPIIKKIDAATRLAMQGKRTGTVVVQGGKMYDSDARVCSSIERLPNGVYKGEELIAAYGALKNASDIGVKPHQVSDDQWDVVLFDTDEHTNWKSLSWRACDDFDVQTPEAGNEINKAVASSLKLGCSLATKLPKGQLRLFRITPDGILRFFSTEVVADWYFTELVGSPLMNIAAEDVKKALAYKGGNIKSIGTSGGKINFIFTDDAYMRADKFDTSEIEEMFTNGDVDYVFKTDDDSFPTTHHLLTMISEGSERSGTVDGKAFLVSLTETCVPVALPFEMAPSGYTRALVDLLAGTSDSVVFPSPAVPMERSRFIFKGTSFRAALSTALSENELIEHGVNN